MGALRLSRALRGRPIVSRLVGNAGWIVLERLVVLAAGFLVNAWFVRSLGPEAVGQYAYALSFTALFGALAGLGLDSVLVRELARAPQREGEILGTALALRLMAGTLTWAIIAVMVVPLREDAGTRILVAIAGASSLFVGAGVFELWFQARIASRGLVLARLSVTLGAQLARCVLILASAPLTAFVALFVATGALTAAAVWALYMRTRARGSTLRWSAQWATTLMRDAWPMVLISIGIAIYMKADQVMLPLLAGDKENGLYAPAVTLSEVWHFIPMAVAASAYPVIVKAQESMPAALFEAKLQDFYDVMAVIGYAIAVPIALLAGPLVHVLYGDQFARTADVLRIHVLSVPFVCLGIARGRYLLARNMLGFTFVATLLGAVGNVGLNLMLIPGYGAVGAAWATFGSYAVANYISGVMSGVLRHQTAMLTRALFFPWRLLMRRASVGGEP